MTKTAATPAATLGAVWSALASLPALKAGSVRAYRGQTRDFGRMLPTGLRGTALRSEHIFRAYTTLLASDVASPGDDMANYILWTQAIAQHYGRDRTSSTSPFP